MLYCLLLVIGISCDPAHEDGDEESGQENSADTHKLRRCELIVY
jgi:hypothetical protein